MLRVINSSEWDPILLLSIRLAGQKEEFAVRLTDAQERVVWRGYPYTPVSLQRSQLSDEVSSKAGTIPSIAITIQNVDRRAAELLNSAEVEGSEVELYQASRGVLGDNDPLHIASGEARSLSLGADAFGFEIVDVLGQQEDITVPRRVYQSKCNYTFGTQPHCGVDLNGVDANDVPISYTAVVSEESTADVLLLDGPFLAGGATDDMMDGAIVVFTNGRNGTQARPVVRSEGLVRFLMRKAFMRHPAIGDACLVRRQCLKTLPQCELFRGNTGQFGGYPYTPPVRFKPTEVKQEDVPGSEPPTPP